MWALQSVLDDMLRRILLLSINDNRVTTRRYVFGQEPPVPYPVLVLHRPGCEDPLVSAMWKLRKPVVQYYGLVLKHSAPIVQKSDSFGFLCHAEKFWIPPTTICPADADDDVFGDQVPEDDEFGSVSEPEAGTASVVPVEAIRFVPILESSNSSDVDESASGWFWENESGDLVRYQMIEQAQLEAAFQSYQADNSLFQFPLIIAAHPDRRYIVDFQEMVQVNLDTQNTRSILRQDRQDISLQEMFASFKEADRVSGRLVRLLSKYDEPSEFCSARWHELLGSNTLTIVHDATSISFLVHSVVFKETVSTWEFHVCIASSSKFEDIPGISGDTGGLNTLMRDVRLNFGPNSFPLLACHLSSPVDLPDLSILSETVGSCIASASGGTLASDIEEMSEEEQLMLAMALSNCSPSVERVSDASNAQDSCSVVSSCLECADQGASMLPIQDAPFAPHSAPLSDAAPALQGCKNPCNSESGICCSLTFSIPFDACSSLPSASAKVNICVGDQFAPLGTLRFEEVACDDEDRRPSDLEHCTTSTILETFRVIDENCDFIDEQADMSSLPALVGGKTFLDHAMIDNAVQKILSQELLVSCQYR